jgi:hypothetical protein
VAPTRYFLPSGLVPAEPGAGMSSQLMVAVVAAATLPVPSTAAMLLRPATRMKNLAVRLFGSSLTATGTPASSVTLTTTPTSVSAAPSSVLEIFISASKAWRSRVSSCLISILTRAQTVSWAWARRGSSDNSTRLSRVHARWAH